MDDLKFFAKSKSQRDSLVHTDCRYIQWDIVGNLEKRSGERGKVITTDGVRLPDRQHMKDIEETGYTYLRILESDTVKEKK